MNLICDDVLLHVSEYLDNKSKCQLSCTTKLQYIKLLTRIYKINEKEGRKLDDDILSQNKFKYLRVLYTNYNSKITTCNFCADTLIELHVCVRNPTHFAFTCSVIWCRHI